MVKSNLAIITISMKRPIIDDLLLSLSRQKDQNYHLYIIDYASDSTFPDDPHITVLRRANRGYAYAVNEGVKQAYKDRITRYCVINDDTYFEREFITNVKLAFDKHPASIIGGKIYYAPGYEYHKSRYKKSDLGHVLWYAGGVVDYQNAWTEHRGVDEVDVGEYDTPKLTEYVTGCLTLFDHTVVGVVGYWDESYFLYYEDADFCERAKRRGIKIFYEPGIVIWHKISQSTGGSGSDMHVKYQTKNQLKWGLKYVPIRTKAHLIKNYAAQLLRLTK